MVRERENAHQPKIISLSFPNTSLLSCKLVLKPYTITQEGFHLLQEVGMGRWGTVHDIHLTYYYTSRAYTATSEVVIIHSHYS